MLIDFKKCSAWMGWFGSLACALSFSVHSGSAQAQGLQITEGQISIRALAERQRRMEEAEFLSKLNPGSGLSQMPQLPLSLLNLQAQAGALGAAVDQSAAVQNLAPLMLEPLRPAEPEVPVNTVLSVYGPEGQLVAEVSKKGGNIERYEVGDSWAGYTIVSISAEGVALSKGGRNRLVSVGGRL